MRCILSNVFFDFSSITLSATLGVPGIPSPIRDLIDRIDSVSVSLASCSVTVAVTLLVCAANAFVLISLSTFARASDVVLPINLLRLVLRLDVPWLPLPDKRLSFDAFFVSSPLLAFFSRARSTGALRAALGVFGGSLPSSIVLFLPLRRDANVFSFPMLLMLNMPDFVDLLLAVEAADVRPRRSSRKLADLLSSCSLVSSDF